MDFLDTLALARWQFGLTTVYHFLFVPITIGLSTATAIFQTVWLRSGKPEYLRLTRFIGNIFLINFAMGVVTGIVQEFQFGMNWSEYSRFVGDIFGAPLAMEGLLAFFFEATFIGLWIFGWDRLSPRIHTLTIWATAVGTILSAYFIIAANAFMQNPVGYTLVEARKRAELTDIWAVVTNPVALAAFPHTLAGAGMVTAGLCMSVGAWQMWKGRAPEVARPLLRFGLWGMVATGVATTVLGDILSGVMVATQPMKMAAAEATYQSVCGADASFSLFTLGTPDGKADLFSIRIPYLLTFLANKNFTGCVEGLQNLQADYQHLYGPGDYMPIIWITYWAFRWMIGLGALHVLIALVGLWLTRGGRVPDRAWVWRVAVWSFPLSLAASIVGWIFTEMGRQPWIVFKLLPTASAVSPSVTGAEVLISLVAFTLIYGILAVVEARLIIRVVRAGPPDIPETRPDASHPGPDVSATPASVY